MKRASSFKDRLPSFQYCRPKVYSILWLKTWNQQKYVWAWRFRFGNEWMKGSHCDFVSKHVCLVVVRYRYASWVLQPWLSIDLHWCTTLDNCDLWWITSYRNTLQNPQHFWNPITKITVDEQNMINLIKIQKCHYHNLQSFSRWSRVAKDTVFGQVSQ